MPNGDNLIDAILANNRIRAINSCDLVSWYLSEAVYGVGQDDGDPTGTVTENSQGIVAAGTFAGTANQTAVWHFMVENPVHHFVAMPFWEEGKLQFFVLMAWVNRYTVGGYIDGSPNGPAPGPKAFKRRREIYEYQQMLNELNWQGGQRTQYFGVQGAQSAITYYKYPPIAIATAVQNVGNFI